MSFLSTAGTRNMSDSGGSAAMHSRAAVRAPDRGRTLAAAPPHVLHVFATFCAAGSQVRTAALVNAFGEAYRHTFVVCDGRTEAVALLDPGVQFELAPLPRVEGPLGMLRAMRQVLAQHAPDLLLTYNWGTMDAVLAARSLRLRHHIHHEDGFNIDEAKRLKARRNFTRRVALRSTDLFVPSRTLEQIARRKWRLPRVHFIPNGVDATRFAADPVQGAAFRASLGIPADALVIGSIGHLRAVKNFPRLVRAAAAIDPRAVGGRAVHLVLVGEGEQRATIEAAAARCAPPGGKVHLPGHIVDLKGAYSAFDVFTLTSDSEQQPVSLLEAMSAGCAVAATDVGDIRLSLPSEARGQCVPLGPHVEAGLAEAFARLLGDDALRARLGEVGRRHVQHEFSLERMQDAHAKLWRAALAR